jgi:hypothetical protein
MSIENSANVTDYITAISAVIGIGIAGIGLSAWKKQLRGTSEYELAKKLMLEVYRLRDALQATRNPFLSISESDKDDTKDTWEITAYNKRWDNVREILTDFYVTSLEAEVVWDHNTKQAKKSLLNLVRDLNFALEMFVMHKNNKAFTKDFQKNYRDTINHTSEYDKYSKSLNEAVKAYEKILKPYLKK